MAGFATSRAVIGVRFGVALLTALLSTTVLEAQTTYYRSIGTALDYGTYEAAPEGGGTTLNATNGSDVVDGVGGTTWSASNRGRGDRISICDDPPGCATVVDYTILWVESDTRLRLTTPYAGTTGNKEYTVTRKFATMQTWADCVDSTTACEGVSNVSLITDDRVEIGVMYADGEFTGTVDILGTTDVTHTITLTADGDNRHYGVPGAGVVIDNNDLPGCNASTGDTIQMRANHVTVEWLEVLDSGDDAIVMYPASATNKQVVRNNLVRFPDCAYPLSPGGGEGIDLNTFLTTTINGDVYNNVVTDGRRNILIEQDLSTSSIFRVFNNTTYNCTLASPWGCGIGVGGDPGANTFSGLEIRNNIVHTSPGPLAMIYAFSGATFSNNITSDASGDIPNVPIASLNFVDYTNGDFHIQTGSEAEAKALPLPGVFHTDIDNLIRAGEWDIGADEIGKPVYYSVGKDAADLKSGSPIMTLVNGTATLSVEQPDRIGVGDVITYDGGASEAFIHGRTSKTVYTVRTAIGVVPANTVGAVDTITRAFNSLSLAQTGSSNGTHLNTTDLAGSGFQLNWSCYADGDGTLDDMLDLTGWTTGPSSYIRIYTPVSLDEVGISQRHTGTAGTGFRLTPVATGNRNIIYLRTPYVRLEGLEIDGAGVTSTQYVRGITVLSGLTNVGDIRIDSMIIHDLHTTVDGWAPEGSIGIFDFQQTATTGPPMRVTNNIIYDITSTVTLGHLGGIHIGSRATSYVANNTVYGINNFQGAACGGDCGPAWGIYAKAWPGGTGVTVNLWNNYVGNVTGVNGLGNIWSYDAESGATLNLVANNVGFDTRGNITGQAAYATYFQSVAAGAEDLHLQSTSVVLWGSAATDLSADANNPFDRDIDRGLRDVPWDIGADEFDASATTSVRLSSFVAQGRDAAVLLEWETVSETDNLGFHLYRSRLPGGPWTRTTQSIVPGMGTSPEGQTYSHLDSGLDNGTPYFYRLEDVETSGRKTSYGPVVATPQADPSVPAPEPSPPGLALGDWAAHGDPTDVSLRVVSRTSTSLTLELRTGGFYSRDFGDGTARLAVPGFLDRAEPGRPLVPTKRLWTAAVAGRGVRLATIEASDEVAFDELRPPTAGAPELIVAPDGTRRTSFRPVRAVALGRGTWPRSTARVLQTAFQGEEKKAYLELAPLRLDAASGQLRLARRLLVQLAFDGAVEGETGVGSRGRGAAPTVAPLAEGTVLVRFATRDRGLHAVSFEDALGPAFGVVRANALRLSRRGAETPFRVEPRSHVFGPGSLLYFYSEGPREAYSDEAVYELALDDRGGPTRRSPTGTSPDSRALDARPGVAHGLDSGALTWLRRHDTWEENAGYFPTLFDAVDSWLWDRYPVRAAAPSRDFTFTLSSPVGVPEDARLVVHLQGMKDDPDSTLDHHVLVRVNGVVVAETSFEGLVPEIVEADVDSALLREGSNTLTLERGAGAAALSMVHLERFSLGYPRALVGEGGVLEGVAPASGLVSVPTLPRDTHLLDITGGEVRTIWLPSVARDGTTFSFMARDAHHYLAVAPGSALSPLIRPASPNTLRDAANQADWIVVTTREFLDEVEPLRLHRQGQGLSARAVAVEDVYDAFSQGEPDPGAIADFLAWAFHEWTRPSPRYVLLLGEATYDPKGYVATAARSNLVPTPMVRSPFLWAPSDLVYAAVNGEDSLPDISVGRLNANTSAEATGVVAKILDFETSGHDLTGNAVLVADDPGDGHAGDFEANVQDIALRMPGRSSETIYRRALGDAEAHARIRAAFDSGASLVSYVGHGSYRLWAANTLLLDNHVDLLQSQSRQPLLLTMTCSTGYFVPTTLNSITERLVLAEGKGAIAAFSPTSESYDDAAHLFHRAVVDHLESGGHSRLGDLILDAQVDYADTGAFPDLLALYHLFGDPALKIR